MAPSAPRSNRPRAAEFTTPLTIPGGAVAGAEVVRELPPEVSLTVWQALRSVLMWAAEEPASRGDLFEPCAMGDWERELLEGDWDDELRSPIAVIVGELRDPARADPESLARACLCVTDWSIRHDAVGTALAFAEAAGLCWYDHPRYAWTTGRILRTHGRYKEAEKWFKRAARLASNVSDGDAQSLALNSLGNLYYQIGSYRQAATSHNQALRTAKRHHLRDREGEVLHDLCVVTAYLDDLDRAEEYAYSALEIYCDGHPRLFALAHDVAVLWMRRGHFARALPVLVALVPHFDLPHERVIVLASTARAAAACGQDELYSSLSTEALELANDWKAGQGMAHALYELALGAATLERWDAAERLLDHARAVAQARGEPDVVERTEEAREAVHTRRPPEQIPLGINRMRGREPLVSRFVVTLQTAKRPSPDLPLLRAAA
jgi:tetratricopeptide (TPR) repeat protein